MKSQILIIVIVFLIIGCKPSKIAFSENTIDLKFAKELIETSKGFKRSKTDPKNQIVELEEVSFDSIRIFKADLIDVLVNRDNIIEESVKRYDSTRVVPLGFIGNYYSLFIITAGNTSSSPSIFIPSIFNGEDSSCIRLGPALVGNWAAGRINFYKTLKFCPKSQSKLIKSIFSKRRIDRWVYVKKENEYCRTKSIYKPFTNFASTKNDIKFEFGNSGEIPNISCFKVKDIYNAADNKFGGYKPIVFNMDEIFEEKDSLIFYFFKTK